MGNTAKSVSQMQVIRQPRQGEWLHLASHNNYEILKHAQQGIQCQQYTIQKDSRLSELQDFQIYEFRCSQQTNFVRVYNVEKIIQGSQIPGIISLRVKTQRIPARLSELGKLSVEQGLLVLRQGLLGYQQIFKMHGPVKITERMIGFNQNGKIRVWVNENFSKNTPESRESNQPVSDKLMVQAVYGYVSKHLQNGKFPPAFHNAYEKTHHNFDNIIQLIRQFSEKMKLKIPTSLKLVPKTPSQNKTNVSVVHQNLLVNPNHNHLINHHHSPIINHSGSNRQIVMHSSMANIPVANNLGTLLRVSQQKRMSIDITNHGSRITSNPTRITTPNPVISGNRSHNAPTTPIGRIQRTPNHINLNRVEQVIVNPPVPIGTVSLQHLPQVHSERTLSPHPLVPNQMHASIIETVLSPAILHGSRPATIQTHVERGRADVRFKQSAVTVLQTNHRVVSPRLHTVSPEFVIKERYQAQRSFQYPKPKVVDLRNAQLLAYAPSEVVGLRNSTYQAPHVQYISADPQLKMSRLEKRDTVFLKDQRSKSEYIKSIVDNPKTPRKNRGRTRIHEQRQRMYRGQPILHENFDQFMERMRKGQRPKSCIVRGSVAGRITNLQKKPAVFAAQKIVTGETTVQKSPKKRYVSADPASLGITKNELNKKSPKLIKFPIKKQVVITGYERTSFEQDLQPIIKQSRRTRQIPNQSPPRNRTPEQTPWKVMTTSVNSVVPVVVNPERVEITQVQTIRTSDVKIHLVNPLQVRQQHSHSKSPKFSTAPQIHTVPNLPYLPHLHTTIPAASVTVNSIQTLPEPVKNTVTQVSHISHVNQQRPVAPRKSPHHSSLQQPSPKSQIMNKNTNHYSSSEQIMRIVEQSKRFRAQAAITFEKAATTATNLLQKHHYQSKSINASDSALLNNYSTHGNDKFDKKSSNLSSSDDYSTLRPETLFEPKPNTETQQSSFNFMKQPIIQKNVGPSVGNYQQFTYNHQSATDNYTSITPRYNTDLTHTFGIEKISQPGLHQRTEYQTTQYRSEFKTDFRTEAQPIANGYETQEYHRYGPQQVEINYYKKNYEPYEYGNSCDNVQRGGVSDFYNAPYTSSARESIAERKSSEGTSKVDKIDNIQRLGSYSQQQGLATHITKQLDTLQQHQRITNYSLENKNKINSKEKSPSSFRQIFSLPRNIPERKSLDTRANLQYYSKELGRQNPLVNSIIGGVVPAFGSLHSSDMLYVPMVYDSHGFLSSASSLTSSIHQSQLPNYEQLKRDLLLGTNEMVHNRFGASSYIEDTKKQVDSVFKKVLHSERNRFD